MTEILSQPNWVETALTQIFATSGSSAAENSGEGWTLKSVRRDVGTIHELTSSGPFEWSWTPSSDRLGPDLNLNMYVVFLEHGSLRFEQPMRDDELKAGSMLLCSGWLPKRLTATAELKALILSVPSWWAVRHLYGAEASSCTIDPDLFAAPVIIQLARKVFELDDVGDEAQAVLMLAGLLKATWPLCPAHYHLYVKTTGRIGRIIRFIGENIGDEDLSPQRAADALKCSLRTIYKTCADHGASFNSILMEMRLATGEHMLCSTDLRVSEVAYTVGFTSLSHFCRVFKERTGISPKKYRQRYETAKSNAR